MKKMDEPVEKKYEKAFSQLGEVQAFFPYQAKQEMGAILEEIYKANGYLKDISSTAQSVPVKGGFAAETFHTETHNLNAIINDDPTRAVNDMDSAWTLRLGLKKNDTPDIAIVKDGQVVKTAQVKYYRTAEASETALRQVKDGKPHYDGVDAYIAPSDQVNTPDGSPGVRELAGRTALREKAKGTRPQVQKAAENVRDRTSDVLESGQTQSEPLTKKQADELGKKGDSEYKQGIEDGVKTQSTFKQMGRAAKGAAAITAISAGVFNTVTYVNMVRQGKMTETEAVFKIAAETVAASADSAVKAATVTGAQSVMVRVGAGQVAKSGLKAAIKGNAITTAAICTIDGIRDMVRLGCGKMTKDQFYERQGKNVMNTGAGVFGSSVGTSMGLAFGVKGLALVGGISGGLIAGMAMNIAIENHIEASYKHLVENTGHLKECMDVAQTVSNQVFEGQVIFSKFLEQEAQMDVEIDKLDREIEQAGDDMSSAIDMLGDY